jgi:hypothetical protein
LWLDVARYLRLDVVAKVKDAKPHHLGSLEREKARPTRELPVGKISRSAENSGITIGIVEYQFWRPTLA